MNSNSIATMPKCLVAIAGSAGALEAFESFFKALPKDLDAAFVVLQHMDPRHKSFLVELLARTSELPVREAKNGEVLRTGHIYVLEPGTTLELNGATFASRTTSNPDERMHPIDNFFSTLATHYGTHAVGIIVSGTGTDGTAGLRLIQQGGGRTLVQTPSEAKFDGMPRSAVSANVVDSTLPIKEIAMALGSFVECAKGAISEVDHSAELNKICDILRQRTGHDFSAYKKTTVARRVERRIQANQFPSVLTYIEFLEKDPAEAKALLRDLLISVTQFFRDPETFAALKELVIPRLFDQNNHAGIVRVWVPACATGEEAYTIAILLSEYQQKNNLTVPIQIFATDIDRAALEFGRQGVYSESISEHMPPEILSRYFKKHERGLQAAQELREMCLFSEHSLLKNSPFSKIDLISCRNLFIYWEADLQNKVVPLFHYSLSPSGFLLLGPAENVPGTNEFFKPLDKKHRIFQKVDTVNRGHLMFPVSSVPLHGTLLKESGPASVLFSEREPGRAISSVLLENFAPPAFVISEHGDVAFYSGKTGRYLEPATGVPSNNIFDIISKPLRPELHALIHRCIKTNQPASRPSVSFEKDDKVQTITITVRSIRELNGNLDLYLVVIQEIMPARSKEEALQAGIPLPDDSPIVQQLEEQLRDTRDHLQSTIEEVKSSNEELLSMNEELQSANEELSTSKEELQSTNEELQTVNAELSRKLEELDASNSDLQNFLQGVQVPILFLNRDFRVQKFTPPANRIFRLIPSDLGRRITDITSLIETTDFEKDFNQVLETLQPIEKELRTNDQSAWYIMRISPYRTVNNVIAGVVLAFADVTDLKRAQETKNTLAAIVESSSDAIISKNLKSIIMSWNQAAAAMFGYSASEIIGKSIKMLIPQDRQHEEDIILASIFRGEGVQHYETERLRKDGTHILVSISVSPVRDAAGTIIGAAKIVRDISGLKKTERALKDAVRARDEFLSVASHELKTPLTSLKMQAQLRKRNLSAKNASAFTMEKLEKMIEGDERQINRLTRLIDDMLDIARIQSGKLTINPESVDLCALVKEVVERFSPQLASAKCELMIDVCNHAQGEWDRFRIEQVATNLITNAMKYGAGKPVHVRIETAAGNAIFSVKDNGIGIAKSDQERIFQQFERAVKTNEVSGLGLGLYIVKQILDAHGGRIRVESKPDHGAEFIVELPLSRGERK